MRNHISLSRILFCFCFGIFLFACGDGVVGNKSEVKIGNQIWVTKNLDVNNFRNGDPITVVNSYKEWTQAIIEKKPACCFRDFNAQLWGKYGKFYNAWAVKDSRGLAPEGWHIPTREEWKELESALSKDPEHSLSSQLRADSGWESEDGSAYNGTNKSGFAALPQGYLHSEYPNEYGTMIGSNGIFEGFASWWCEDGDSACYHKFDEDDLGWGGTPRGEGHAVRCIKN
jgi:uncharacterized protein (TIGR02145 family)